MSISFKICCTCLCEYTVNSKICTEKIICPNWGLEYTYSKKLIQILKVANDIPNGNISIGEIETYIIPDLSEYMD